MKTSLPKVSVLMPNYNCEKYLPEAIDSILKQSFTDFEFIIIDDCSNDNSWEIIQEYAEKDNRIITLRNNENIKICKTLNKGLEIAKGKYIARMDSDDIAVISRLEQQVSFLDEHKSIWIVWWNVEVINAHWNITWTKRFPTEYIKEQIWYRNPFIHPWVLIKKQCFEDFWWYKEWFLYAEDLELWIRFGQKWDFWNIDDIILKYRIFWENSTLKKQEQMIQNTLKARKQAIKLWYKMPLKWKIYYVWTWCMKFLPPKFVLFIFNKLVK